MCRCRYDCILIARLLIAAVACWALVALVLAVTEGTDDGVGAVEDNGAVVGAAVAVADAVLVLPVLLPEDVNVVAAAAAVGRRGLAMLCRAPPEGPASRCSLAAADPLASEGAAWPSGDAADAGTCKGAEGDSTRAVDATVAAADDADVARTGVGAAMAAAALLLFVELGCCFSNADRLAAKDWIDVGMILALLSVAGMGEAACAGGAGATAGAAAAAATAGTAGGDGAAAAVLVPAAATPPTLIFGANRLALLPIVVGPSGGGGAAPLVVVAAEEGARGGAVGATPAMEADGVVMVGLMLVAFALFETTAAAAAAAVLLEDAFGGGAAFALTGDCGCSCSCCCCCGCFSCLGSPWSCKNHEHIFLFKEYFFCFVLSYLCAQQCCSSLGDDGRALSQDNTGDRRWCWYLDGCASRRRCSCRATGDGVSNL